MSPGCTRERRISSGRLEPRQRQPSILIESYQIILALDLFIDTDIRVRGRHGQRGIQTFLPADGLCPEYHHDLQGSLTITLSSSNRSAVR